MPDSINMHKVMDAILFVLDDQFSDNGWCVPEGDAFSMFIDYQYGYQKDKLTVLQSFYNDNFDEVVLPELERNSLILVSPYDHMLVEVIQAYKLNLFNICIPSLFSIIESMLVFLANDGDESKVRYISGFEKVLEVSMNTHNSELTCKLANINKVIKSLFNKIDFDLNKPSVGLNRHESAHGRKVGEYNKSDCLKLLVLVSAIKSCYNN